MSGPPVRGGGPAPRTSEAGSSDPDMSANALRLPSIVVVRCRGLQSNGENAVDAPEAVRQTVLVSFRRAYMFGFYFGWPGLGADDGGTRA